MEQIIFNQQNHIIVVEPNAYGDLEYKQRVNWSSNNHIQRERANLLFRRVEQTIYNIANDIDTGDVVYTGRNNDYICRISDGIGRILFEIVCCSNNKILIIIKDFIWDYKNSTNTWWNIVEDKTINKQNKTYKTMKQKIRLTESQLHDVIRRCINEALDELDPRTYAAARDEQNRRNAAYDKEMEDYNNQNFFKRMFSKKPEQPKGYNTRSNSFNNAAVDSFNSQYGGIKGDVANGNYSSIRMNNDNSLNLNKYTKFSDGNRQRHSTNYDFNARQTSIPVDKRTDKMYGVVTDEWDADYMGPRSQTNKTQRGMNYNDTDPRLSDNYNSKNPAMKALDVASQMANGSGKYTKGKGWQ